VRLRKNGWGNSRDPEKVALAYTVDSWWRKPRRICPGAACHHRIPDPQMEEGAGLPLIKELWAFGGNRIAVRFAYEWHDDSGNWFRSYGNENWEFDSNGLMHHRHASINDLPIKESERKFRWDSSKPRPLDHPGLTALGM
jgi:nuclear transport factor 2 (NTF2) superfamily protein